ncbi:hypothetical protein TI39_contig4188g00009 [Zymoseptoria brevis]|uniref:Uncharacterized protein n=1 Tax=Zymoseptoria brevis TaxID=1047168 RepID=A0A0F4GAT6_9PEZI|nr:hypothetical protein TI39_contig4188g00009 [Zymoseptoria brevis]
MSTGISMTASTGQLDPSQSTIAISSSASQSATGSVTSSRQSATTSIISQFTTGVSGEDSFSSTSSTSTVSSTDTTTAEIDGSGHYLVHENLEEQSLVLSNAASFSDATKYRLDGTRLIDASTDKVWTYAGGHGSSIYMFTQADPSQPTDELSCSFGIDNTLSCFAPNNPAINLLEVVTYAQPYGDILWIGNDLFYQSKAKSYKFVCAGGNSGIAPTTITRVSSAAVDTGTPTTTASCAGLETTAPTTTTAFFEAVASTTTAGNMPTCADFLLMAFDDSGEYLAHLNDQDGALVHSVTAISAATRYRVKDTRLIDTTTADPDNGSPELNCHFASDGTLSCFDPVFPEVNQLQAVNYSSVVGNALFIAEQGKVNNAPATTTKPAASAPTCGGDGHFRLAFGDASHLQNIPLYVYATDNFDQATRFALKGTTLVDPSNYDLSWLTGMSAGNGPVRRWASAQCA